MTVKKVSMKDPVKTYPIPPMAQEPAKAYSESLGTPAKYDYSSPRIVKEPVGILATDATRSAAPQKQILQKMSPARGRGPIPTMKSGGKVSSASKRADGCAVKGKTRGRMV